MPRYQSLVLAVILTLLGFQAGAREDTRLDTGWRFNLADTAGAEQPQFDDSAWQAVTLPHSWGWDDAQLGKKFYRGPAWYRLNLDVGAVEKSHRYFLRFEAASLVADVYLNGQLLGQHRGGFGAFAYELTDKLAKSGTNVVAVRVSNEEQPDIAPISGDFSVYGGLYRPVHLIVTSSENFTVTDHGSPGVAWFQTSVSPTQAVVDVTAQISNGTKKKQSLLFAAKILDATGQVVATVTNEVAISSANTEPHSLRLTLDNPHLWNGRKDPYLYQAVVELSTTDGAVLADAITEPLGLRFYHVDPDKGFFLNGQPYHLHGVNRHQDRPVEGWAITEADMDEDIGLIKEIGATVVRCCHYQHSDYFYRLCDQAGILVWAEIPQVNTIHNNLAFETTSSEQLRDLSRQNINHPAIFAWSLFNEVGNGTTEDPHRVLQDLKIIANGEDPTRPTIGATCISKLPAMNKIPDLLGWNIYPGWYAGWGEKEDFTPTLEKDRYTSRSGGFCVSEYGAGANVTQHEQNPVKPVTTGQWHPEEWQAIVHEAAWKQLKAAPYVWGTFAWNMFDFVVSSRHEGNMPARNDKGLVTYDRKTRKDAFYFYKANWSEEPVVYLASRRFTERTSATTDVKVYSNNDTVELSMNGASQGSCTNDGNGVFIWKNVQLSPGTNHVTAQAVIKGQTVTDACDWTLKPAATPAPPPAAAPAAGQN